MGLPAPDPPTYQSLISRGMVGERVTPARSRRLRRPDVARDLVHRFPLAALSLVIINREGQPREVIACPTNSNSLFRELFRE